MRETLFRGQKTIYGGWVYGSLAVKTDSLLGIKTYFILNQEPRKDGLLEPLVSWHNVKPETVGQYTGLKDKNGQRIFEGDVIHTHYANVPPEKCNQIEQVVFHNGRFCGMYSKPKMKMWANLADGVLHFPQDKSVYMDWCEVIGNIHDNPELLKEGGKDENA